MAEFAVDHAVKALEDILANAEATFKLHPARLAQLRSAMSTVTMALQALEDEQFRHSDLAVRVKGALGQGATSPNFLQLSHMHPEMFRASFELDK